MLRHAVLLYVCVTSAAFACGGEIDPTSDELEQRLQGVFERAWSGADDEDRELIARSQIAWRDYRGATCEMYASRGGWTSRHAYAQCLKYMTQERVQDLRLVCLTNGDAPECEP